MEILMLFIAIILYHSFNKVLPLFEEKKQHNYVQHNPTLDAPLYFSFFMFTELIPLFNLFTECVCFISFLYNIFSSLIRVSYVKQFKNKRKK